MFWKGPDTERWTTTEFDHGVPEADAALIAGTTFSLDPGEATRLCYVYGYLPADGDLADAQALVDKYTPALTAREHLAANVSRAWSQILPEFSLPAHPWLGDEMRWHAYVLRAGVAFDTFYDEHTLDQGKPPVLLASVSLVFSSKSHR